MSLACIVFGWYCVSENIKTNKIFHLEGKVQSGYARTLDFKSPSLPQPEITPISKGEDSIWSLSTFFDQKFSGSNFKVGQMFADWGTHKSYFATYKSEGLKISGTWHVPNGDGPFPLLILNHGYFPPEEYTNGYGFGREQKYFARNGYAVFHTDYRNYAYSESDPSIFGSRRPGDTGFTADSINAIVAIQAAAPDKIDTSRVGMLGHSLGGGITLTASLARPDLIDAAVLWGPVSSNYYNNFHKWIKGRMNASTKAVFEANFGSIEDIESFKAISSYSYLDRLQVPIQIQQGEADEACPVEWAQATRDELERLGKDFNYIEYEDAPHVFWNEQWDTAAKDALDYLDSYLKDY